MSNSNVECTGRTKDGRACQKLANHKGRCVAIERLSNLAAALRVAGGLQLAYGAGYEQHEHEQLYSNHGYRKEQDWVPGEGKAMEGWER